MAEPFPESVKLEACQNAGYKCKCELATCTVHSSLKCPATFASYTDAEYHHIDRNGAPTSSNCRVLCHDCHVKTRSYGTPA